MPKLLSIKCPSCTRKAEFEFATFVVIKLKKDVVFFRNHPTLVYRLQTDSCGHKRHTAYYFPGLHGEPSKAIHNLPSRYDASDWNHSKYPIGTRHNIGSVRCQQCHYRSIKAINWPNEAYYNVEIKGQTLWSFNTDSTLELRAYIHSKDRQINNYTYRDFLFHLPTNFKTKKMRDKITKKLDQLLVRP
jgi:hypothetical protein